MSRMIAALMLALAAGCSSPEVPSKEDAGVERRLILKSEVQQSLSGAEVLSVRKVKGGYRLDLTADRTFEFDERNYALVSCDSLDRITINGDPSIYSVVSNPYYTVGSDGMWYKDGARTFRRAAPVNEFAGPSDICLTNILERPSYFVFNFSDGTADTLARRIAHRMYVRKTANQMDVYIGREGSDDYIMYPFKKRYRAYAAGGYPSYLDNWGIAALQLCSGSGGTFAKVSELFLNGEAEMALNVPRSDEPSTFTYVGGTLHGFENILQEQGARQLTITVDGVPVGESDTLALTQAGRIVMTQKSALCQAYSNSNPFAEAFRTWTFEDGRLTISIELKLLRDIQFKQGMFGMLCVLRHYGNTNSNPYLTCWAVKDNKPYSVIDIKDGWTTGSGSALVSRDAATYRITEYGEKGWSFALVVDKDTRKNGGMHCGTNGNAYNKIYFDMTGNYAAKAGEVLAATVHWEIENNRLQQ